MRVASLYLRGHARETLVFAVQLETAFGFDK